MSDLQETRDGAIAIVTFNRPVQLSALTFGMMVSLIDKLDRLATDDDIGAIVLTGAGKAFCVGGDVGEMTTSATRTASQRNNRRRRLSNPSRVSVRRPRYGARTEQKDRA